MARPRKLESVEHLKAVASNWADLLHTLRDGRPGLVEKLKWSPWVAVPIPPRRIFRNVQQRTGDPLVAEIVPVTPKGKKAMRESLSRLAPLLEKEEWSYWPPWYPEPEIWKQLKHARATTQVRQTLRKFRKWWTDFDPSNAFVFTTLESADPLGAVASHAGELVKAKRMPNYPRSRRDRSDDKRIEFFAKVMAGLVFGLSPSYATKRLAHWHCPKTNLHKIYAERVRWISQHGKDKGNEKPRHL